MAEPEKFTVWTRPIHPGAVGPWTKGHSGVNQERLASEARETADCTCSIVVLPVGRPPVEGSK